MSDEDDDLFADSGGDTDDLIAESQSKPVAKPKKLKKVSAKKITKRKRDDIPGMLCFLLKPDHGEPKTSKKGNENDCDCAFITKV